MPSKVCKKCQVEKPLEEFYNTAVRCKVCVKARLKELRDANLEEHRRRDRDRYHSSPRRRAQILKSAAGYAKRHPVKYRARNTLNNALRDGRILKSPLCESCGSRDKKIEAHHDDYSKPLAVRWLCQGCHGRAHSS